MSILHADSRSIKHGQRPRPLLPTRDRLLAAIQSPAGQAVETLRRFNTTAFRALKPFVHPCGVGKVIDGQPKHLYSKSRCQAYRELRTTGQATRRHHVAFHRDKFSRKTVAANQTGCDTRYYTSSPRGSALLYLDLDPPGHEDHRKHGTPYTPEALNDRAATMDWLLGLAGKHLFVSADRRLYLKLTGTADRELLRVLGRALNAASPYQTDIEIKGTYRAADNYGCLGRLPLFRHLDFGHVDQFKAVPAADEDWVRGFVSALEEMAAPPGRKRIAAKRSPLRCRSVSFSINLDDTRASADLYWSQCPRKTGRTRITQEDHRTLFAILSWCKPNADGTNPYMRHKALWDALFAEGRTARPFNFARYKALRDFYSAVGLIDWHDVRHYPRAGGKGKAAQWRFRKKDSEERRRRKRRILVKTHFLKPRLVAPPESAVVGSDQA
jgi:hypothetical protein